MAIAAEQGGRETLATTFILDGDVHLNEPPGELAEYAEAPWDIGLREIAKASGLYLALPGMAPRAEYRVPWPGGQNRSQVVTTAADMRRELDELHVDVAVLYPGQPADAADGARSALRARAGEGVQRLAVRALAVGGADPARRRSSPARSGPRRAPTTSAATPGTRASAASTCRPAGSSRSTAISSTSPSGRPRPRPGCPSRSTRSKPSSRPSRSSSTASRRRWRSTRSHTRSR